MKLILCSCPEFSKKSWELVFFWQHWIEKGWGPNLDGEGGLCETEN